MSSDENWQRKVVFERGRVEMKCEHGQLARTCLLCEMRDENLELKAKLAELEARCAKMRNLIDDAPHGIGCQHSYRNGSSADFESRAWTCTCWKALAEGGDHG